jgi:RimJ/RimL family protein N-acetyltransferase
MTLHIETERLILRDFEIGDSEAYVKLSQDPKYQRFYSEEDCSIEKSKKLVEMFISQQQEKPRQKFQLAITLKNTNKRIGTCGIRIEDNQQASVGCGIAREFQSFKFAYEASLVLLDFGFTQHNLHRIYAETISKNIPAINLCQRLGMRIDCVLRENRYFKGNWWSTTILSILKHEFEQQKCTLIHQSNKA